MSSTVQYSTVQYSTVQYLHHSVQVLGPGALPLQLVQVILHGQDLAVQISVGGLHAEDSERGHSR